ncbi:MAG: M23 family metallopeptidase [Clostridia bacterium]|nr:M23 family metallopeptidase [Clostridia bacterium]
MEQSVSPYRKKTEEKTNKYLAKFIRQICICGILVAVFLGVSSIPAVKESLLWEKINAISKYDVKIDDVLNTVSEVINYIEDKSESSTEETVDQMKQDVEEVRKITNFVRPVPGVATLRFGKHMVNGSEENHTGVDLAAAEGTPVKAAIAGTVIEVKELTTSFGKFVRVKNGDILTTYAHCSSIEVEEGEDVVQGEVIAYSGSTGNVTGPHLHFEVSYCGRFIDPGFLLSQE